MEGKEFNKELIRRYRDNKATQEELEVFFHLMSEGGLEKELEDVMNEETVEEDKSTVVPMFRRTWFRIAAAAILILMAGGTFLLLNQGKQPEQPVVVNNSTGQDVAPGGNKAILTLADNSTITLDNASNGALAKQGNTEVLKLNDGQIAYNTEGKPAAALYNTISTPRGGQYNLTLADGSKVWLNAASSLRFPASFVGKERKVELTGEAYFEVAKNAEMPFIVSIAGKSEVEVLGTHFNINSYADEAMINTTLLEGSVKVTGLTTHVSQIISPGQQAQQNNNGNISLNNNPDVEEVMAWKNGKFNFGEAMDIESVMRQVSRWYDVDVEYEGKVNGSIGGSISRNVNASQLLQMLETTGTVKFKIEGKKVIVMTSKK